MGQVGAKMTLCWPTWRQDVPKLANLEATWRAFGKHLGDFFLYLGRGLAQMGENQKNDDSSSLLKVFLDLGGALGGYVGSSWRYVEPSRRHLGATWRQDVP